MPVPVPIRDRARTRRLVAAGLAMSLVAAACGGSASSTTAPSVAASPPPSVATVTTAPTTAATPSLAPTPAPTFPPLTLLWQQAGPTPAVPETWQPAIDPVTGDVWVASSYDNVFWIFSPDGKYLESWGAPGSGPGQLSLTTHEQNPSPFGSIAFLSDGSFYVADIGNYRVEKFDKDRRFVLQWGSFGAGDGQFSRAWSLRTDGTTVYVGDDSRLDIQAFDLKGHFIRDLKAFPVGSAAGGFFALDPGGHILEADTDGSIAVYDPTTGAKVANYPMPAIDGARLGMAVDAAGDVFVNIVDPQDAPSHPIALVELDPQGKTIGTWSTAGETIAVAPDEKAIYIGSNVPYLRKYALPTP